MKLKKVWSVGGWHMPGVPPKSATVFVNIPTQIYIKIFEEKVPGKVGECIFES